MYMPESDNSVTSHDYADPVIMIILIIEYWLEELLGTILLLCSCIYLFKGVNLHAASRVHKGIIRR